MKYLSVIWGMVIFLLACLPCADSGTAFAQDDTTVVQADYGHADAGQENDLCSPLCECNCCGGISLTISFPQTQEPPHNPSGSTLNTYLPGGAVSPSFAFWHPPKA
ncbi:DUF6660 family protein [uncultured Pontibacter sp.]|uniref:DUF2946 domain-containing protein n=1 Tax=Pontibacter amylolyticus TaxID=1424080 RepID=A0ABQ1W7B1_9BACT|nr:hypothetical protein GCM10011323_23620 [Pontibacter amylolyticus]